MEFKKERLDIARETVELAVKAGRSQGIKIAAEAFVEDTESLQVNISGREVEQLNAVAEAGVGLRIIREDRTAFGSTNELSRRGIAAMAEELVRKAAYHTPDEFNCIPGTAEGAVSGGSGGTAGYEDLGTCDPAISAAPVKDKIERALKLEAGGLDASPKIAGTLVSIYQDGTSYKYLANSNGISGWFCNSFSGGGIEIMAADGEARESGSAQNVYVRWADFKPEALGREAALNALNMLGARPIKSCEVPMVISPEIAVQFWTYIAAMLSADAVQKGQSLFADKVGSQVAAGSFTLIDDGRLRGGVGSSPVDGEGVATRTTPLIVDGRLETYLYDSYTARKGKTRSTGNRSRGGFATFGSIGTTNLYLKPGAAAPEAVFADIDKGFYLTVVLGLFAGIDGASGDFSIPAAGFMIEKGRKTFPVRGVTIGGNLFDLLKNIDKVGSDLTWYQSNGSPTVSVKEIKIGGA